MVDRGHVGEGGILDPGLGPTGRLAARVARGDEADAESHGHEDRKER